MSLKEYPIMFNDTEVPFFPDIETNPKNIENKHQSESGKDIIQTVRTDKWSVPVKMSVADDEWVRFFYDLYVNADSVTFKQYSPLEQGYSERLVRIEDFKYKQVKHSEDLPSVMGVWEISFTIEEF
jgi:hypothetical protein